MKLAYTAGGQKCHMRLIMAESHELYRN